MLNKKILITGAAGFIGSHLAEYFIKKGYKVVAFDRYNSSNSFGWLDKSPYKKKVECVLGDIRDYDSVFKTMKNCDFKATIPMKGKINSLNVSAAVSAILFERQRQLNED